MLMKANIWMGSRLSKAPPISGAMIFTLDVINCADEVSFLSVSALSTPFRLIKCASMTLLNTADIADKIKIVTYMDARPRCKIGRQQTVALAISQKTKIRLGWRVLSLRLPTNNDRIICGK